MSNTEIGYCSWEEYSSHEPLRVDEKEMCVSGLYVVMFALDTKSALPVHKYPATVQRITPVENGREYVLFTIDNCGLADNVTAHAQLQDGYWLPAHSMQLSVGEARVISGYFRDIDRENDMELELQDMIEFEQSKINTDDLVAV